MLKKESFWPPFWPETDENTKVEKKGGKKEDCGGEACDEGWLGTESWQRTAECARPVMLLQAFGRRLRKDCGMIQHGLARQAGAVFNRSRAFRRAWHAGSSILGSSSRWFEEF